MNIKTDYNDYFKEWSAWSDDTADYDWDGDKYIGNLQIGYGKTEEEAINNLKELTNGSRKEEHFYRSSE